MSLPSKHYLKGMLANIEFDMMGHQVKDDIFLRTSRSELWGYLCGQAKSSKMTEDTANYITHKLTQPCGRHDSGYTRLEHLRSWNK